MRRLSPANGFALVIAITLMGFILLILVALSSRVQIGMQSATTNAATVKAREVALFSLGEAMGQLQRFTGPDQRTTAAADRTSGSQPGSRLWTGAWANTNSFGEETSNPQLLTWLISGNGSVDFSVGAGADNFGQLLSTSAVPFDPADSVVLGAAESRGSSADDILVNGQPGRLLMGPGTVDRAEDYVVAPLVSLGGTPGAESAGKFAWWIGDEGVKARFNLVDPRASGTTTDRENFYRLLTAQRPGIELMTKDGTTVIGSTYDASGKDAGADQFRIGLARVDLSGQIPLLEGFGTNTMRQAMRRRSPDYSLYSQGVLADSLRGGLRHDLTALFYQEPGDWTGDLKDQLDEMSSFDVDGSRRIAGFQNASIYNDSSLSMSPSVPPGTRSPSAATWEQLDSFFDYSVTNNGQIDVQAQSDNQMGVSPVLLRSGMAFDVSCAADGTGGKIHFFPHVVLWNPYNTTLRGSYRVRMEFADNNNTTAKFLYFVTPRLESDGVTPIPDPPYAVYHQELIAPIKSGSGKYSDRTLEFEVGSIAIPPGEAYVFTPGSSQPYDNSGSNGLTNGYNTSNGFTRNLSHVFTPEETSASAIVLANEEGGNGGTVTFHLLDDTGNELQLIDAVGLAQFVNVDNDTSASQATQINPSGFNAFRDIEAGPVNAGNQVGISIINSLQETDGRFNWLANVNQRARSMGRAWFEWNGGWSTVPNWSIAKANTADSTWKIDLLSSSPARSYIGPGRMPTTGTSEAILFNIPQVDTPLISIGQLQHAPMSATGSGLEPSYPFGNAYADPRIQQDRLLRPNTKSPASEGSGAGMHLTDVSYLLNRALWDRYFLSGRPDLSTSQLQSWLDRHEPLPFAPLTFREGFGPVDVEDFDLAASSLLNRGAFNVNSTSVEAWTAVLASLRDVEVDPETGISGAAISGTPYIRTPYVPGARNVSSRFDRWAGFRSLTDNQVRQLADEIVNEVRARGPFLSLADFVNRTLEAYPDETGLSGTLQSAIDAYSSINMTVLSQDRPPVGTNSLPSGKDEVWKVGAVDYFLQNAAAPRRAFAKYPGRAKAAMAPGFLSQADMLQALAPALASRSDTFTIRGYGESADFGSSGLAGGRVWYEAIVQRLPEYVDAIGNAAEVRPVTGGTVNLTTMNQSLGRQYELISFRWLEADEI
ncbi:hypothetical protein [Puniceicoccus vermicola]|uniref:Uncharacterized protein n=1 Tax=Puniceicoccus vermicola TaxID=388746 RepID=A0A7X1B4U4_9BACT|nr:hypothetical protein [Puniceicoccus vermicola]MBC2604410.1 hypothetical protein [Puniceicoccus vermicola]